jgi:hypothetical protein
MRVRQPATPVRDQSEGMANQQVLGRSINSPVAMQLGKICLLGENLVTRHGPIISRAASVLSMIIANWFLA